MASFVAGGEALAGKGKGAKRRLGEAGDAGTAPSSSDDFLSDSSMKRKKKKKHNKDEKHDEMDVSVVKDEPVSPELDPINSVKENLQPEPVAKQDVNVLAGNGTSPSSKKVLLPVASNSSQSAETMTTKACKSASGEKLPWSKEDTQTLLESISRAMPDNDNLKYSTQAERLDWEEIKLGDYTIEQCKQRFTELVTNVRKFRTMREIVGDVKSFVDNPPSKSEKKHPDMPKRPLTPYFRFFLAKRAKIAAKHPELSQTELTKVISKEFKELQDKKKKKYQDEYDQEMNEFHVKLAKFKEEHPELYPIKEKKSSKDKADPDGPPKAVTCLQLFVNSKIEEAMKKGTQASRKDMTTVYRTKYASLSDHKKMKYIKKANEAKAKYDQEMAEYCEKHPDHTPKDVKSFLTKAEQKIKDKIEGKPDKPPPNGYGLYSTELLGKLPDLPSSERMHEVSRRWKALPDEERDDWNKRCRERHTQYDELYSKYVDSLPEEEQRKILADAAEKEAKKQANRKKSSNTRGRQKPVAAVFLYISENKAAYKKKYPEMNEVELTRMLAKQYADLSDVDKDKYRLMEEEQRDILAQCMDGDSHEDSPPPTRAKKAKRPTFPGEPKKPPSSGYQMFTTETIIKLTDIPSKERIAAVSKKWKLCTQAQKTAYAKRRDALVTKYKKDLEKFKKNLSPKDLRKYEDFDSKGKKGKAVKKEEKSSSSSSSEDAESSDSDNDSSSSSTSGDESSSDDESGSESEAEPEAKPNGVDHKSKEKLSTKEVYSSSDSESSSSSDSD